MFQSLPLSWQNLLEGKISCEYYDNLIKSLAYEYKNHVIFPRKRDVFRAFNLLAPGDVRVVILGQDPYHGKGQANGFAFAVNEEVETPPSLKNIWKEVENTYSSIERDKTLQSWAAQGVFMLNSVLTVRANHPSSHKKLCWQSFTDAVIHTISNTYSNLVFMLWGNFAKEKRSLIQKNSRHLIMEAAHPSPFSAHRGFFGCKHFLKANEFFKKNGEKEIKW